MSIFRNINISDPLTSFDEVRTAEKELLIGLKSSYGVSNLRDVVYEDGVILNDATTSTYVSNSNGEYNITLPATASKSCRFESAEYGRYQAGTVGETGIGIRAGAATLSGEQVAKWGYFLEGSNGFYFKLDSTGLSVNILRAGVEESIARSSWNGDKLDGTGASGLTLDLTDGSVFQIEYVYYGYGAVEFAVYLSDEKSLQPRQHKFVVHTFFPDAQISIANPNLPISVYMENGATASAQTIYVGGRQYSIIGNYRPVTRTSYDYTTVTGVGTSYEPILSFRKKSASEAVRVLPAEVESIVTTNDVRFALVMNGTLTSASYASLTDINAAETALEKDVSATAITGGVYLDSFLIDAARGNQSSFSKEEVGRAVYIKNRPITLVAKALTGTADIIVTFKNTEEW